MTALERLLELRKNGTINQFREALVNWFDTEAERVFEDAERGRKQRESKAVGEWLECGTCGKQCLVGIRRESRKEQGHG